MFQVENIYTVVIDLVGKYFHDLFCPPWSLIFSLFRALVLSPRWPFLRFKWNTASFGHVNMNIIIWQHSEIVRKLKCLLASVWSLYLVTGKRCSSTVYHLQECSFSKFSDWEFKETTDLRLDTVHLEGLHHQKDVLLYCTFLLVFSLKRRITLFWNRLISLSLALMVPLLCSLLSWDSLQAHYLWSFLLIVTRLLLYVKYNYL